ncbi:MAG: TonB-linked SusC/RagA family outer membrane protein [Sphingobacteriales bacterium]|jgi:TonB-linked SusC/RagA family outer membrane protein
MARKLQCTLLALFLAFGAYAQKQLKGTVKSAESGENLPGVNVVVKGTTTGTVTDYDGNFSLTVPDNANTLVFSYLGFKTVQQPIDRIVYTINLENDALGLDEVVVTSLGVSKQKKALGYAVEEVSAEELTRNNNANIVNSISGKVAGVLVTPTGGAAGAGSSIRIRGNASLTGNNEPLFVIDGLPIDNSTSYTESSAAGVDVSNRAIDINSEDVASMTVLKGAAATALYGIRAANGAIIITTKKGKGGSLKAPQVSISSSITIDRLNKMHDLQNTYGQGAGGQTDAGLRSWGAKLDTMYWDGATDYSQDKNGRLIGQTAAAGNPDARKFSPYDNVGDFYKDGVTTNNTVSFQAGSDDASYYVSLGNFNQSGITPDNTFERTSIRANGSFKISEKLTSSVSTNFTKSGGTRLQRGSNTSGIMLGLLRTPPSFDNSNGFGADAVDNPSAYEFENGDPRRYSFAFDNPWWTVKKNPFQDDVNRFIGQTQFDYQLAPWLKAQWRVGTDFFSDQRKQVFAIGSRTAAAGRLLHDEYFNQDVNSDVLLIANKQINSDLDVNLTLGQNSYSSLSRNLFVQGDGYVVTGFNHISNTSSQNVTQSLRRKKTNAVYGEASMAYKRMLYVSLTGRNEWSSTLPAQNNSFFSPSASVGFVFTEALGITDNDVLPYGKLRLSYGVVGNDAPLYATNSYYESTNFSDGWVDGITYPFNGTAGFGTDGIVGNSAIVPEKTTSYEVGTDLRFFNNALSLDLTYYNNVGEDQTLAVPVSAASGYTAAILNAGKIKNEGIEALIGFSPIKSKNFSWDVDINFAKNNSEVLELADGVEAILLAGFGSASTQAVVGEAYGAIFGTGWLRDDNDNIVIGENGYPMVSPTESVLGDPNPDWNMGILNSFSYKDFSLSGLVDIRKGGDIWNGTRGALINYGTHGETSNRGTMFTFEGVDTAGNANTKSVILDEAWYKGNGGGFGAQAETFVEDASWIRLREIALSYKLPSSLFNDSFVKGINVTIIGTNLFLLTNYSGVDPETNTFGNNNGPGLEYFNTPGSKSLGFNFKVSL